MQLTHVCMWQNNKWVPVTAEEAKKLHPGGTVSASSEIFVCELCGKGVAFTDGPIRERYFKHDKGDAEACPEGTHREGTYLPPSFIAQKYQLPIRINSKYEFFLGLLPVPLEQLSKAQIKKIEIISNYPKCLRRIYNFDRLEGDKITYIPLGLTLAKSYQLNTDPSLYQYWPQTISGVQEDGTLFDKRTGKLLVPDSDVTIQRPYLLLTDSNKVKFNLQSLKNDIQSEKLNSNGEYTLYSILVANYSEAVAKFFWHMKYRLTESPIYLQPMWPLYRKIPYLIQHNHDISYFYVNGDLGEDEPGRPTTKVFPSACLRRYKCGNNTSAGSVIQIRCNERQQVISVGRTNVLYYTYFRREQISSVTELPKAVVTDRYGQEISEGIHNQLPKSSILQFEAPYDGSILIEYKGRIVEKRTLKAGEKTEISHVQFGSRFIVLQGLDTAFEISFQRVVSNSEKEDILLARLNQCHGKTALLSANFGRLFQQLDEYPKVQKWFRKMYKQGAISEEAFWLLKSFLSQDGKY